MADAIRIDVDDTALAARFNQIENADARPLHAAIGAVVQTLIRLGFRNRLRRTARAGNRSRSGAGSR